jgi:hypothetical protein
MASLMLGMLPYIGQAQGTAVPKVVHDKDGDVKMISPDGKVKVDKDGDAKMKMDNGRKVKVDKDGNVKMKPKRMNDEVVVDGPPDWAPAHGYRRDRHVYFQDYYTFYDPNRGYVYWQGDRWVNSPTVPVFLDRVDLGKARIQVLNDLDLSVRPEERYQTYQQLYPAERVEVTVPVPTVR